MAPVTVFEGKNGAGKSSILDCVATLLSWYPAKLRSPKGTGSPFKPTDIRTGQNAVYAQIKASIGGDEITEWSRFFPRKDGGVSGQSRMRALSEIARQQAALVLFDTIPPLTGDPKNSSPLVVHYSVNRTVLDVNKPFELKEPLDLGDPLLAFEGAFNATVNFHSFFAWYRQREDFENERRMDSLMDFEDPEEGKPDHIRQQFDHQLEAVRQAIKKFTEFTDIRIRRFPLHMEIKKEGKTVWLDHLSDGEKCLLAMVGDLARRLAILSGKSLKNPLQGRGVILIDEIDLHLHPAWQREVIPKLVQTFPNCQFIVSTHSPQVISDMRPEAVFLLRQEEGNTTLAHPEDSFGQTSDRILEDTMRVPSRPQKIKDDLRSLFDLISRNNLDAAKKQVITLKEKIGSDPDLVRASTLIRRKEVLGE